MIDIDRTITLDYVPYMLDLRKRELDKQFREDVPVTKEMLEKNPDSVYGESVNQLIPRNSHEDELNYTFNYLSQIKLFELKRNLYEHGKGQISAIQLDREISECEEFNSKALLINEKDAFQTGTSGWFFNKGKEFEFIRVKRLYYQHREESTFLLKHHARQIVNVYAKYVLFYNYLKLLKEKNRTRSIEEFYPKDKPFFNYNKMKVTLETLLINLKSNMLDNKTFNRLIKETSQYELNNICYRAQQEFCKVLESGSYNEHHLKKVKRDIESLWKKREDLEYSRNKHSFYQYTWNFTEFFNFFKVDIEPIIKSQINETQKLQPDESKPNNENSFAFNGTLEEQLTFCKKIIDENIITSNDLASFLNSIRNNTPPLNLKLEKNVGRFTYTMCQLCFKNGKSIETNEICEHVKKHFTRYKGQTIANMARNFPKQPKNWGL